MPALRIPHRIWWQIAKHYAGVLIFRADIIWRPASSTLALWYAIAHPEAVLGLVLRIF